MIRCSPPHHPRIHALQFLFGPSTLTAGRAAGRAAHPAIITITPTNPRIFISWPRLFFSLKQSHLPRILHDTLACPILQPRHDSIPFLHLSGVPQNRTALLDRGDRISPPEHFAGRERDK